VRQHARPESISKRAPSTTRTSLHFRINNLRAVGQKIIARRRFPLALPHRVSFHGLQNVSAGVAREWCQTC
jgi:hypothetical protein